MKRITVSDVPHMLKMWDYERNTENTENVSARSHIKMYWRCPECDYSWEAAPNNRFSGTGMCPCHELNLVILRGVNDVITRVKGFFDLLDEDNDFDAIASQGIKSKKLVNYRCKECGKKWQAEICSQITKNEEGEYTVKGCSHSYTFRRKREEIPLCTEIDAIIRFWDDGNPLDPAKTRSASKQKAHFICKNCGYDWSIAINEQANGAGKCRCCELKIVPRKGFSDLFTLVPEAEKNYDFEKNEGIDIYSIPIRDRKIILNWRCPGCGRERQASLASCIVGTRGAYSFRRCRCNEFNERNGEDETSQNPRGPIAAIPKYVKYWDFEMNKDIDINLTFTDDDREAHWKCKKCGHKWTSKIKNRKDQLDCPICDRKRPYVEKGKTDVLTLCPELASIYDFETNECNGINIYTLGAGSGIVVHFKCKKCGHEWDSPMYNRVKKKNNNYCLVDCPKCSNSSFRSVPYSEQYPDLEKMYREDLNGIPLDSIRGAKAVRKTKYQWNCMICGRTFESTIDMMVHSYQYPTKGCPYCSNRKMSEGKSFAEIHPELMDEYAPDNEEDPYATFPNSAKTVKWICKICGHEWNTDFCSRHAGKGNCPVCNRTAVIKDKNSFAAVYPDLAKCWSPKNEKSADEVFYNLYRWLVFICPTCGGEYNAWLPEFVSEEDHGCPYCRGNRALPGYNSLKALYPEIAKRWSDSNELDPDNIVPTLSVSANWVCAICHGEYSTPIRDVVAGTDECPYCKGKKVLPGYNSLKALYPEAAQRWSSNNDIDPEQILPSLSYEKLWICGTCHGEYSAPIRDVVAGTDECPYCKGTKVLPGYNSFADKHPNLIEELDIVSNYLLPFTPNEVLDSSNEKFWWTCKKNKSHKYRMSPRTRLMYEKRSREPCLYCRGHRRKLSHFVALNSEQQEQ